MADEKYNSATAQIISAGGDFLNSVKNPVFILFVMFMLLVGFLFYKGADRFITSLDKVGDRIDALAQAVSKQESQNNDQISLLKDISRDLLDYHKFQKNRQDD